MYRAIGISENSFSQQNIGPLCRGKECWITSPFSHYEQTLTRVVISGASFEDERALTAKRGLEHGLAESESDRFDVLWRVLSQLSETGDKVYVIAIAEDVPLDTCPIDARGVDVFATAELGGTARRWRCRWELPILCSEDLKRAMSAGAQCLLLLNTAPEAEQQEARDAEQESSIDDETADDETAEDVDDLIQVGSSDRRWQLNQFTPVETAGLESETQRLKQLEYGWTEQTRLPSLVDLETGSSSSWLTGPLTVAAHRLVGFHRLGPKRGNYVADAIWDVLDIESATAVILFHQDKHGSSFGIYHQQTSAEVSPFVLAVEHACVEVFVIPFAIPPIVARWDRAIKDLRATWDAQGLGDFPIPVYEPPQVDEDSEFDSDDSDDSAEDASPQAAETGAAQEDSSNHSEQLPAKDQARQSSDSTEGGAEHS